MDDLGRWTAQSQMSDPGGHAAAIAALPSDIGRLNAVIQGLLVHSEWLSHYGLDAKRLGSVSRKTLPVADRLAEVLGKDTSPLEVPRPAHRRAIGTCRDFALMLCCILRSQGIPSRVRCGFAAYFHAGWEDHWVCEYWDRHSGAWRLSDAQIDPIQQTECRIDFDLTDVPRRSFMTAGQAWLECRAERADPSRFGQGAVTGLWFVKVNTVRDHYVVNDRVTSAWDGWRSASPAQRVVHEREHAALDRIAAHPEQPLMEIHPDW